MGILILRAKWTVLDEDIAEPAEISALVESFSKMDESTAREYFKKGLQVEVNGHVQQASGLSVEFSHFIFEDNLIYIKHLELKWDSELDAAAYAEEYGESVYMVLEFENDIPWWKFEILSRLLGGER